MTAPAYEIEIRFLVDQVEDAFALLPFLQASLGDKKPWSTEILSQSIFDDGRLLRIGRVPPENSRHYYLGYKDVDVGTFANIRREWGEEITNGAGESAILAVLGIPGAFGSPHAVSQALAAAGYHPFMAFSGADRLGFVEPLRLHTKAMWCPAILGDRVLIELEMSATSLADAYAAEETLRQLADQYYLTTRLVRAEPPTMLYHTMRKRGKP